MTELLLCRRVPQVSPETESLTQTAISYGREPMHRGRDRKKWGLIYSGALALALAGLAFLNWQPSEAVLTCMLLSGCFGAYFCLLAPDKLPALYDSHPISIYIDGPVRMNIPGVRFHNRNWPHILQAARVSLCALLALLPNLSALLNRLCPPGWLWLDWVLMVGLLFAGLFLPIYWAGRKYR